MIQDDIMYELQFIPEPKLFELYDLIHFFRLGLTAQAKDDVKIDKTLCLKTLRDIQENNLAQFSEIEDVATHIQSLKNEIS